MSKELPPLPSETVETKDLERNTRRSFVKAGVAVFTTLAGLRWLLHMSTDRETPWLLRKLNDVNDGFWGSTLSADSRISPAKPDLSKPLRSNGDAGLEESVDEKAWRLEVVDPSLDEPVHVSLDEIKKMPSTEMSFTFKCIEGWSQDISCRGVKVSDFAKLLDVGERDPGTPFQFAALESINGGYYVSMDAASLWHPQTLLCYEINGQPLTAENGAPLRLMTATKYGVKNIKQLGRLRFADSPPADYWAERGYQDGLIF